MIEITDNWTKNEFNAFVMLHIANADLKISKQELLVILKNISEDEFNKIEMVWSKLNDFECLKLIKEQSTKHYPENEGRDQLIKEVTELAKADDKFSVYEQNLIRSLKKIL